LAHGLFNISADDMSWSLIFISILGVALIGIVNLLVSFSLALFVALRSKEVKFFEWSRLTKLVFGHIVSHPSDFFWPRDKPMKYARIDSQGHMIFDDTSAQRNGKTLPSSYVVRRLSDVRILPESKQGSADSPLTNTDIYYDHQPEGEHIQPHTTSKKVVDLDDGLADDVLNDAPYSDDIQYDNTSSYDDTATKDIKTPLPKPKKPPNLPS